MVIVIPLLANANPRSLCDHPRVLAKSAVFRFAQVQQNFARSLARPFRKKAKSAFFTGYTLRALIKGGN